MPNKPILIMAGGTGGHVYPALAVADYLRRKGIQCLGTVQGDLGDPVFFFVDDVFVAHVLSLSPYFTFP